MSIFIYFIEQACKVCLARDIYSVGLSPTCIPPSMDICDGLVLEIMPFTRGELPVVLTLENVFIPLTL